MFSLAAALIAWRGSHLGTSQQSCPLPFLPSLPPAMLCNAWMQKCPSLDHQCSPVHPSPGPCMLSLPTTIPRCLCASLFYVSALVLFLSTSKLQKYLIKGGFKFKPVQQVKLHAGEYVTPTTCYSLCAPTTATALALSVSCSVQQTFLQEQVEKLKRNKFLKRNINLLSVSLSSHCFTVVTVRPNTSYSE